MKLCEVIVRMSKEITHFSKTIIKPQKNRLTWLEKNIINNAIQ